MLEGLTLTAVRAVLALARIVETPRNQGLVSNIEQCRRDKPRLQMRCSECNDQLAGILASEQHSERVRALL
jgi:hypothetical protein